MNYEILTIENNMKITKYNNIKSILEKRISNIEKEIYINNDYIYKNKLNNDNQIYLKNEINKAILSELREIKSYFLY